MEELAKMKMAELKEKCKAAGRPVGGNKKELQARLKEIWAKEGAKEASKRSCHEALDAALETSPMGRQALDAALETSPTGRQEQEGSETPPPSKQGRVEVHAMNSSEKKRKVLDLDAVDDDESLAEKLAQAEKQAAEAEKQAAEYKKRLDYQEIKLKIAEDEKAKFQEKILDGILQRNATFDALIQTMMPALASASVAKRSTPIKSETVVIEDEEWVRQTSKSHNNKEYWLNTKTCKTQWEPPVA